LRGLISRARIRGFSCADAFMGSSLRQTMKLKNENFHAGSS
jgi:hypothetical protein